MYCPNCGTENSVEASFCSKCGKPLEEVKQFVEQSTVSDEQSTEQMVSNLSEKKRSKKKPMIILAALVSCILIAGAVFLLVSNFFSPVILDANKFYNITPEQLVKIMGEPTEISNETYNNESIAWYGYVHKNLKGVDGQINFGFKNNKIYRVMINSEKYYRMFGEDYGNYKFKKPEDIFKMLNITPSKSMESINSYYLNVSDKINYFCPYIDEDGDGVDFFVIEYK